MKKFYAISGIIAGICVLLAGILITVSLAKGADGNFKLFGKFGISFGSPGELVSDTVRPGDFDSIDVKAKRARVEIVADKDNYVEYSVYSNSVKCEVKDNTLVFREDDSIFSMFNFGREKYENSYIRIHVKNENYNKIKVKSNMGDISVNDIECTNMNIDADMGGVYLNNVSAASLIADCDMGNLEFDGSCSSRMDIGCDMGKITVAGYLDCDVKLDADMGDIDFSTMYSKSDFDVNIDCDMGKIDSNSYDGAIRSEKTNNLKIDCDMGSVRIKFGK